MDKIRCSHCKGRKKVAKLGGMLGDCNLCAGTGMINQSDKPQTVIAAPVDCASDVIKQVAAVAAVRIDPVKAVEVNVPVNDEPMVKVDPKKAIYKRKTASK